MHVQETAPAQKVCNALANVEARDEVFIVSLLIAKMMESVHNEIQPWIFEMYSTRRCGKKKDTVESRQDKRRERCTEGPSEDVQSRT
jgi:hypothetical protein